MKVRINLEEICTSTLSSDKIWLSYFHISRAKVFSAYYSYQPVEYSLLRLKGLKGRHWGVLGYDWVSPPVSSNASATVVLVVACARRALRLLSWLQCGLQGGPYWPPHTSKAQSPYRGVLRGDTRTRQLDQPFLAVSQKIKGKKAIFDKGQSCVHPIRRAAFPLL
jgi:hypothetical protein